MNTPADLAPSLRPVPGDGELDALLELFVPEESAPAPARPSLRTSAARLVVWTQVSSRRAARWGAVPVVSE